jgi:hypothetical protein
MAAFIVDMAVSFVGWTLSGNDHGDEISIRRIPASDLIQIKLE